MFIVTFLGTAAGTAVVALPLIALWSFTRYGGQKLAKFGLIGMKRQILRIRFMWMVLKRRRKPSEYRSWYKSELSRIYLYNLISKAPKARAEMTRDMLRGGQSFVSAFDERRLASPIDTLIAAIGSMSMDDLSTPAESYFVGHPNSDRARWLITQPLSELTKWSIRLSPDDRTAWLSWLRSQDSRAAIERHLELITDNGGKSRDL